MDANRKATILTIGTVAVSIMGATAMHGDKIIAVFGGVPAMLRAWADQMPLGAWSFIVALVLGTLLWLVMIVKLPQVKNDGMPHFNADTITLTVAIFITVSQQWLAETKTAGALLNAFSLGAIAGLAAPYIGRGIRALFHSKSTQ